MTLTVTPNKFDQEEDCGTLTQPSVSSASYSTSLASELHEGREGREGSEDQEGR